MGVAGALALVLASGYGSFAAEVERFVISQARPQLPLMAAYLDIVDGGGQPVPDLAPANFAGAVGTAPIRVVDIKPFRDTGEGVAYAFLIDISGSMPREQFNAMRAAIQAWIGGLAPADRAAIATFGDDYQLRADFTGDRNQLVAALNSLAPHDQHTRLYLAIDRAVELQQRVDSGLPFRRVIVVLSDGKDEGSALTPDDVLLKLRASRLPIYSVGLSHLPGAEKQRYLDVLNRFSNASGGLYEEAGTVPVPQLYSAIRQAILRVFVAHLECPACQADGRAYPLEITLTQGERGLKAAPLDVIPLPGAPDPPTAPPVSVWRSMPWWLWAAAGLVLLAVAFALLRKREDEVPVPDLAGIERGDTEKGGAETDTTPDAPGKAMKLTVVIGHNAGFSHALTLSGTAVIGRAQECDVVVADPEVSNRHCELALVHGNVLVYDLGSKNRTYVNGVPIRGRHKLEPLDTIQLGDTELRVHFEEI